jgi:hypothetical protein
LAVSSVVARHRSRGCATDFQRPEAISEVAQLRITQLLITAHQSRVSIDSGPDLVNRRRFNRLRDVDARDLGDKHIGDGGDLHR